MRIFYSQGGGGRKQEIQDEEKKGSETYQIKYAFSWGELSPRNIWDGKKARNLR